MHHIVRRRIDMLERVLVFARNNAAALPSAPLLPKLIERVEACLEQLQRLGGRQCSGRNSFLAAASEKARIAAELREQLRDIARIARTLDPDAHPEARSRFLLPRGNGAQRLLAYARAFLQQAGAMPDAFTERGLPADFLEALDRRIAEHEAAGSEKNGGLLEQVEGTAGMADLSRRAVGIVREIDAILTARLRRSPELLAAWKSASHVERAPRRRKESAEPSPAAVPDHPEPEQAAGATPSGTGTNEAPAGSPRLKIPTAHAAMKPFHKFPQKRIASGPQRRSLTGALLQRAIPSLSPGCTSRSLPHSYSHQLP